jgi:excisionase family DNA binding protein
MVPEIAADLRVSKMTVYRLVWDGELPAIRVGRSIRVPREAYAAFKQRASLASDGASDQSAEPVTGRGQP